MVDQPTAYRVGVTLMGALMETQLVVIECKMFIHPQDADAFITHVQDAAENWASAHGLEEPWFDEYKGRVE
jgi:hypothetical protein